MELFGIGWTEMLVIGLVALVVVGPERLPQAARTIGNLIGYLSRQLKNIREEIRQPVEGELLDLKGKFNDTIHEVTDIEPLKEKTEQQPSKHID
jgi:sec-independent protein translocase protein TatB